jgi:hypothetical protein
MKKLLIIIGIIALIISGGVIFNLNDVEVSTQVSKIDPTGTFVLINEKNSLRLDFETLKSELNNGKILLFESSRTNYLTLLQLLGGYSGELLVSQDHIVGYFVYQENQKMHYGAIQNLTGLDIYAFDELRIVSAILNSNQLIKNATLKDGDNGIAKMISSDKLMTYDSTASMLDDYGDKRGIVKVTHWLKGVSGEDPPKDYRLTVTLSIMPSENWDLKTANLLIDCGDVNQQALLRYESPVMLSNSGSWPSGTILNLENEDYHVQVNSIGNTVTYAYQRSGFKKVQSKLFVGDIILKTLKAELVTKSQYTLEFKGFDGETVSAEAAFRNLKSETISSVDQSVDWGTPVKTIDFDLVGMTDYKNYQNHISFYVKHGEANSEFFKIQIGEISIVAPGDNLTGDFDVIKLSDKLAVMAVSEVGPSGDDATSYFCYEPSGHIIFMGKLPGVVKNTIYNGDGTLTTKKRGELLQTWFYDALYRVNDANRFEFVPGDLYEMNTPVTLLLDLPIMRSRTDSSVIKVLKAGEKAVIKASDDVAWCLIIGEDGTEGWFEVYDHIVIKGVDKWADKVFEGLSYAD